MLTLLSLQSIKLHCDVHDQMKSFKLIKQILIWFGVNIILIVVVELIYKTSGMAALLFPMWHWQHVQDAMVPLQKFSEPVTTGSTHLTSVSGDSWCHHHNVTALFTHTLSHFSWYNGVSPHQMYRKSFMCFLHMQYMKRVGCVREFSLCLCAATLFI